MTDYFMFPDTEEVMCPECEGDKFRWYFKGDQAFKCECTNCKGAGVIEVETDNEQS